MVSALLSRIVILLFGTLYPAYASYKAVRTKNVKEYVKWMMYWIVFAFFITVETFADIFLSWIPFYYEVKILFVIWLLSPATKGSNFLYRKFVHPQLARREGDIDEYIARVSQQGYSALLSFGSRGVNYATNIVLNTAMKSQATIAEQLKKSYSLNDLSVDEDSHEILDNRLNEGSDEEDYGEMAEQNLVLNRRGSGAGDGAGRSYSLRERKNDRTRKTQSAMYT